MHQNSILHNKVQKNGSQKEREKILGDIDEECEIDMDGIRERDKDILKVDKETVKNGRSNIKRIGYIVLK